MSTPFALGRKVEHDPRSRMFPFIRHEVQVHKKTWRRYGPVLDQGNLGSCTGNAMVHALNSKPNHVREEEMLREEDAVAIYSLGTQLDQFPGTYPPDDTGSSALGVAKAAMQMGYVTEYRWAFGLQQAIESLMSGPVMVGTWWYDDMFNPTSNGFVRPTGSKAGGHEYLLVGVDPTNKFLTFQNSWGTSWGLKGRFKMTYDHFDKLLSDDGDAMIPVGV